MQVYIDFFLNLSDQMGYWGVGLLMTIESSFIPFPSEIIIPPAAYLASQGKMNIFLVIVFGILGSILGAIINYMLAMLLGRAIIYSLTETRFSKIMLINSKKVEKAEKFFLEYGVLSTLVGRLIPVIRQLISLPAGFSRMNIKKFIIFTALGSGIWVIILACLGYFFGANKELLLSYHKEISVGVVVFVLLLLTAIFISKKKKK